MTHYKHFRQLFTALVTALPLGAGESRFVSLYRKRHVNKYKTGLQKVDACCGQDGRHETVLIKVRSIMGLYHRTNLTKQIGVCFSDSLHTVAGFICFSLCSLYCKRNLTTAA